LLSYAIDSVEKKPILGVGPNQWNRMVRREYGIPDGKATEVHNTWVQIAAELGIPGVVMILSYYGLCAIRLLPIAWGRSAAVGPEASDLARMVVSSLAGSVLACSFVTVHFIEVPYYIALIGAGVLKLSSTPGDDPMLLLESEARGYQPPSWW
jgi:O-antigen ligase